jgi:hypothetical protein
MGKGKDKKDKADKGKSKKDGGGLHIPKPLRKAGKEALKLAREPVVSEVVAAALLSAAAALRENKAVARAGEKGAETVAEAGKKGAAKAADAAVGAGGEASKIGDALRGLALDLAKRTLDNWERPRAEKSGSGKAKKGNGGGKKGGSRH